MSWQAGADEKDPYTHGPCNGRCLREQHQGLSREDRRNSVDPLTGQRTNKSPRGIGREVSADHETHGHTSAQQRLPDSCKSQTCDSEVPTDTPTYFLSTSQPTQVKVDDKGRSGSGVSRKPTTVNVDEKSAQNEAKKPLRSEVQEAAQNGSASVARLCDRILRTRR